MKSLTPKKINISKEITYVSVFVALTIGVQFVFSSIPGVEFVTLLFVCYSFSFGAQRGICSATAFSLLRCFLYGFFPNVVLLYLIYYNLLALTFGGLSKVIKSNKWLFLIVIIATLCTASFTLIDNAINILLYSYYKNPEVMIKYVELSLPIMAMQSIFTAISVALLFIPLTKAFELAKRPLLN